MSDIDNLIKLISDILQPDNHDLRKNAENTLALLRKEKPNELIGAFILILDSTPIPNDPFDRCLLLCCC